MARAAMKDKINPAEIFRERKLIWKLAKNDFKTKYCILLDCCTRKE